MQIYVSAYAPVFMHARFYFFKQAQQAVAQNTVCLPFKYMKLLYIERCA